jgi:hypothetical protein
MKTMQVPVQVTFTDIPVDDEADALCHRMAEGLEQYCNELTSCRVVVSRPHRRQKHGHVYGVRIHLALPRNGTITVDHEDPSHDRDEHALPTIREAFRIARRRLEDRLQKRTEGRRAS